MTSRLFFLASALLLLAGGVCTASPALAEYCPAPQEHGYAVAHAAAALGIPFVHAQTLAGALSYPMVVLAGEAPGAFMTPDVEKQLTAYVEAGGTLVLDDPESRVALNLAGAASSSASTQRYALTFRVGTGDPGLARLLAPEARTLSLGSRSAGRAVESQGLVLTPGSGAVVLAEFDDGSPGLVMRELGRGRVYALGVSFRDLILRPQINRDYEAQRWYDNHFEPSADVPQILLRDWYQALAPGAVTLDPTPSGLAGALLVTHDVDFQGSMPNMLPYARAERALGVRATYFIQTKYVRDYEDVAFFDARAQAQVREIAALGAEIANHTVSHAYDWRTFPLGTGRETAADYSPRVLTRGLTNRTGHTTGGSVGGEVRVPKQLLEQAVPGLTVDAFRSGYLLINPAQWGVQEANGYRFDSSFSADDVMTAFPYTAMDDDGFERESRITEFPVLLTDSVAPLADYKGQFARVLDAESALHGVAVLLIHPDVVRGKLAAETALIAHARGKLWIGGLEAFGGWWLARGKTEVTAETANGRETVRVTPQEAVAGLTLDFARPMLLDAAVGATARVAQGGRAVVLGPVGAGRTVTLTLTLYAAQAADSQAAERGGPWDTR